MSSVDVDKLRVGLNEYNKSLEKHRQLLNHAHKDMENSFRALMSVYGGDKAKEFLFSVKKTNEWFESYIQNLDKLSKHLDSRIIRLKDL